MDDYIEPLILEDQVGIRLIGIFFVHFEVTKNTGGQLNPSLTPFSPESSDRHFDIPIFLSIVKKI